MKLLCAAEADGAHEDTRGEIPMCCACGKQFTTAANLKNHHHIHTGEKPFLCEAQGCGQAFAKQSSP